MEQAAQDHIITTDPEPAGTKRPYKFFVIAQWTIEDRVEIQMFEFDSKSQMARELAEPKFGDAMFRVIRGYELDVTTKVTKRLSIQ